MHSPGQNQIASANLCALAQRGLKTAQFGDAEPILCSFYCLSLHCLFSSAGPLGEVSYFGLYGTCKLAIFS